MAAKGSKSRQGRAKPSAKPDAEAQPAQSGPEEPSSDVEPEQPSAAAEAPSTDAEAETSSGAQSPPEGEGETRPDESQAGGEATAPPGERQEAESALQPGEAAPREPWRYRVSAGLAAVLIVALLAVAWVYGTVGDPDGLDVHTQRLDEVARQAEVQASRLAAAEEAIAGVRSELGQVSAAVTGLEASLGELHAAAETNRQQLDRTAEAIEALPSAVAVPADGTMAGEAVTEIRASLETLEERLASLESEDRLAGLSGSISRLEEEISELRQQAAGRIERAEAATALGRAYAALTERIAVGAPFADELEAVASRLATAPGLDVLRPLAGEGVPTILDLQARLGEIAARLPRDEPDDAVAGDGVWHSIRERLEGMVTIRRADEPDWPAVLARANQALLRGDVAAAIAAVERAPEAAPAGIDAWLADARTRRDAEAGLDELSTAVLRQFAGRR